MQSAASEVPSERRIQGRENGANLLSSLLPPALAWGNHSGLFLLPQNPSISADRGAQQPEALRVEAPDSQEVSVPRLLREERSRAWEEAGP
jgi:hypothetical protein